MSYNKEKALQILENMLQGETNENVITAIQDQQYGLSLGLVAYSQQIHIWSDIPEHADDDTKQYWAALHDIHKTLCDKNVFFSEQLLSNVSKG